MSRTAELQGIIQSKLTSLGYTAYADEAPDGAAYPYVVYSINGHTFEDALIRITIDMDIWDRGNNYVRAEAMADAVEDAFCGDAVYDTNKTILPQFFRYIRTKVPDVDKKTKRIIVRVECQNYKRDHSYTPPTTE